MTHAPFDEPAYLPPRPPSLDAWTLAPAGDEFAVLRFPLCGPCERSLTAAEADVARALLAGASHEEIARRRGTAKRTVANQVASLYRKLDVGSRRELVAYAALFGGLR